MKRSEMQSKDPVEHLETAENHSRQLRGIPRLRSAALGMTALLLAAFFTGRLHAGEKLHVLATFAPIFSLTKNVTGDAATVTMLLPPGVGPHDFALSPADLRKLATADVIVSNGLGLESWLEKAIRGGAKKGVLQIVASAGISTMQTPETIGGSDPEEGPNPHLWLDPIRASKMVETIRDRLSERDPDNAPAYKTNADIYTARLRQLDSSIRAETEKLSEKRLLSFHDSLPYFAARYGFEIAGVFEPFPGKEPTPRYLKRLRDTIREKRVKVLFSEPQYSPQMLRTLSGDLQVPIAVLDPMETGEPRADLYENVMRSNLRALMAALHGS